MGILKGSDPALANEYILLTGHLDAIGLVEPENGDAIVNGAMDNASGIATMLEVARAFKESGTRPKRSIMFVALAGEEKGLLGASYLAKNPVLGNGKIVGLVNLDMPMLTYDFQDVVAFGAEHSTIGGAVSRAIASANVKLSPDPEPEQVLFTRTDHYMFVKEGVPAVSLDTGPANGGAAANADFIKHRYHKPGDDIRQKFDWNAAAKFARINYLIARELADAETAPRWYAGDFFGETFAKNAPKAPKT
jgi:Zn-dependent M28 family amino/carboxypeptidase